MRDASYDNYRLGCEVYRVGMAGLLGNSMSPYYEGFRNRIWQRERSIPELYDRSRDLAELIEEGFTPTELATIKGILSRGVDEANLSAFNRRTREWRVAHMHTRTSNNVGGRHVFNERAGR